MNPALDPGYRARYHDAVPIDRALLERTKASPANVRFRDLCRLAEAHGFVMRRRKGSHLIYRHGGRPEVPLVNLQEGPGGKAKPYQVRQVLTLIETHGLEMQG